MINPSNYWTLLEYQVGRDRGYRRLNKYKCICGCEKILLEDNVKSNKSKSCGCMLKTFVAIANTKHGHASRTKISPTYISYRAMIARCTDTTHKHYNNYGGRGITICPEWMQGFDSFLNDMGERSIGYTLDRIDPNKNYTKDNCKWSTRKEQANNRRNIIERN